MKLSEPNFKSFEYQVLQGFSLEDPQDSSPQKAVYRMQIQCFQQCGSGIEIIADFFLLQIVTLRFSKSPKLKQSRCSFQNLQWPLFCLERFAYFDLLFDSLKVNRTASARRRQLTQLKPFKLTIESRKFAPNMNHLIENSKVIRSEQYRTTIQ